LLQAIQSSFAWSFAQACYQGFSTYNDVTYPFTTQTIITDGQTWSFYVYQLNTTLLHSKNADENPRYNMCWGSKELKLFESFDKETGKLIGFNEDVLKQLIHFYINQPVASNRNMKPYLGEYEQTVADIDDDKRREFLETRYKHLVSNRPRHRLTPEIYAWEKIYKIDNNTRPMAPKRRFFELGINPYARRLDDHTPVYIPKAKRPEGPRSRKMWEKTYYP
jgi:small subunit ribosomal protein S30